MNRPAFPTYQGQNIEAEAGMTLRDYFAAHCPSDIAQCNLTKYKVEIAGSKPNPDDFKKSLEWNNKIESYLRYAYADAMLAERERKTQ